MRPVQLAATLAILGIAGRAWAQEAPPAAPAQPVIVAPELVQYVEAPYPDEAKAAGVEGTVVLEILVDKTGATKKVTVVTPAGHGFDEAAVAAAEKFTWKPGTKDGKPIGMRVTYEYKFTLTLATQPDEPDATQTTKKPGETGEIRGVIKERGTRQPLLGVGVAAVPQGGTESAGDAITDAQGRFDITGLAPGTYQIVALVSEHKRGAYTEEVHAGEQLTVRYYLEATVYDPYQSTIQADPLREEVDRKVISVEEATKIPGTRGDALRAVENMPGVARPPFGSGFLVVRGANPQDTTPYIAGHWVPLLYHFGGLTSVVNSDLLERIDYLPGNFSARFGRAVGGVVDVDLRTPRRDRMAGYVDLNVIDGGFLVEGPIGKGSWAIAARRSWIDAVFSAIVPKSAGLDFSVAPRYYDEQAIFSYPLWRGKLQVIFLGIDDKLRFLFGNPNDLDPALRGAVAQHTGVNRVHVIYKKALSARTSLLATAATGYGELGLSLGPSFFFDFKLWFSALRVEVTHQPFPNVKVIAGTDTIVYPFALDVSGPRPPQEGQVPAPPSSMDTFTSHRTDYELQPGAYFESEIDLGRGVTIVPGARFDYWHIAHASTADPRFSARWKDASNTVRAAFGRYSEQPQGWESDPAFGNPNVRPEIAYHASVGYDRQLTRAVRIESTLYYKWLRDVIVLDQHLVEKPDGSIGVLGYSNAGAGRVMGAELIVRHDVTKRFFGWVSYSLMKADRQDAPGLAYRPFTFDQTHILTVVASWKLPWRVEAGVRFRYVTGNPTTPIKGSVYDADSDVYFPIPGAVNSARIGPFHQLDVRIDKRFVWNNFMMTMYLDVQNAYNHLNPESTFYSFDFRKQTTVTGLPIIPSIGIRGEF